MDASEAPMLTKDELRALGAAISFWSKCLPPENRNVLKNGLMQPSYDRLRLARGALKKLRSQARTAQP